MAEEKMEQGQLETTGGEQNPAGGTEPSNTEPKQPPSFDELLSGNKDYQSAFDRKVSQALTTAREKWERQHQEELDEATNLEKMSETQRKEYQLKKDRAALDAERAKFAHQQLQVSVGAELQKRGLSADFAPYLTGEDSESSQAAIDAFEGLWKASLAASVNDRMRSDSPPRDPKPNTTMDRNALRNLSREEVNKNWDAVAESLRQLKKG